MGKLLMSLALIGAASTACDSGCDITTEPPLAQKEFPIDEDSPPGVAIDSRMKLLAAGHTVELSVFEVLQIPRVAQDPVVIDYMFNNYGRFGQESWGDRLSTLSGNSSLSQVQRGRIADEVMDNYFDSPPDDQFALNVVLMNLAALSTSPDRIDQIADFLINNFSEESERSPFFLVFASAKMNVHIRTETLDRLVEVYLNHPVNLRTVDSTVFFNVCFVLGNPQCSDMTRAKVEALYPRYNYPDHNRSTGGLGCGEGDL